MNLLKKIVYVLIISIVLILVNVTIVNAKTVEITTETLNLRKEPTTDSDIVALISIGDECEVLGEEGDWYKVKYEDYTGYISKEYAKVIGSNKEETRTSSSENTTEEENTTVDKDSKEEESNTTNNNDNTNKGNQGKLNKKSEVKIVPLINSSNIETLEKDEKVTIINELNDWSYIQTDTISGWIRTDNITIEEISSTDDNKENTTDDNKTDNKQNTDKDDNKENNTSTFEEKTMYAKDYINIRKEPNTSSDKLMLVSPNTALKVIGETGDWYKVNTSEGEAYVSKELLSDKKVTVTNRGDIDRTKETTTSSSKEESYNSTYANTSEIVSYAKKFLGVPYVYGGASSSGFDCSGFTMYVYKHFGISMAHGAQSQSRLGKKVTADKSSKSSLLKNLQPGDLVFFLDYETMDEIGHCGIYIGDGNFIHASSGSGYCVKINSLLPGEYYNTRYCAARRII